MGPETALTSSCCTWNKSGEWVRLQIVFHIGQQAVRFIAGRLDDSAIELGQGRCHPFVPADLIASLSRLFQDNKVAVGVHGDEAKAAGKRFRLGSR